MSTIEPTVALATVCGGGVDYEFLLGAIRHHALLAKWHVVLDVTPARERRHWKNLPDNVIWIYDDSYGSGTPMFAFRLALIRSIEIARATGADLVMQVDSDEFVSLEAREQLFKRVPPLGGVEYRLITWGSDGKPYYKTTAYARRLWSAKLDVQIPQNKAWQRHPLYTGNPERHPIPIWPKGANIVRIEEFYHHHLHWTFRQKGLHSFGELSVAPLPIDGKGIWPEPLARWRAEDIPPSKEFE